MRRPFRSLRAQLVILIVAALVVAQAISLWLFVDERSLATLSHAVASAGVDGCRRCGILGKGAHETILRFDKFSKCRYLNPTGAFGIQRLAQACEVKPLVAIDHALDPVEPWV